MASDVRYEFVMSAGTLPYSPPHSSRTAYVISNYLPHLKPEQARASCGKTDSNICDAENGKPEQRTYERKIYRKREHHESPNNNPPERWIGDSQGEDNNSSPGTVCENQHQVCNDESSEGECTSIRCRLAAMQCGGKYGSRDRHRW
jgi:hypothetical protein